jgi:hypothetical protein
MRHWVFALGLNLTCIVFPWGMSGSFAADTGTGTPGGIAEKRPTSVYAGLSFGRDEYRAQELSARIGVSDVFLFPFGISRYTNGFTDASLSFFAGGDWNLGRNLAPRAVLNFYREPNSVTGLGISLSNRFHLEDWWHGKRTSILTAGISGTRYADRSVSTAGTESSGLFLSKSGKGRGGSRSSLLSAGVFQASTWLDWDHSLSDRFGISASVQKYFYVGAAPVDGNAAISDRPFVPNQAQLLVDGFPEWTAEAGGTTWFDSGDFGTKVAFSRARNSSSGVIVAPAILGGWNATEILYLGASLSYAIQSSSMLFSLNAEWVW